MIDDLKRGEALTPLITIVVITRNRAEILSDCLQHLLREDFPKHQYEIVVVDDGSTDRTPAVVKSFQSDTDLPVIRYIAQPHQGVNAARNTGIESARGVVVSFLDDDVLARPDYLKQVWQMLSQNPNFDGVGGPLRDYGGSRLRTCNRCSLADYDAPGANGKGFVSALVGGNMTIKASAFKQVGLFDREISGRGDETEWFHRASSLKFFYDPELWVWHRRDNFNLFTLCRHSFVQGLSVPLAEKKIGTHYRPKPMRIVRPLTHAFRRGCAWGFVLAFREIGSVIGYLRLAKQ
jgi:glycosyltransferase involved in cell wall biosynthesis